MSNSGGAVLRPPQGLTRFCIALFLEALQVSRVKNSTI
jgi:hypothetical protein